MITDACVTIGADAATVWDVFAEVERWSDWTASISSLVALDDPTIEVGHRFAIKQPRMPKVTWRVTEVEPGTSWTWKQRSPGATTLATHEVVAQADGTTLVRQRIDQRGPLGVVIGALTRGMTRRYLALEGEGLKARSEARSRRDASTA